MNKLEGTYQHPLIVCYHELDLSDIEILGKQLSRQLNLTIEIDHKLFLKKKIYNSIGSGHEASLIAVKSSLIPEKKFHFYLDEIAIFIFTDFIEIKFNMPLDYFHLSELNGRKELLEIELLKKFFSQLKSIGIDEVHFGIFAEFEKDEGFNYSWKNIYRIISNQENYFKLDI